MSTKSTSKFIAIEGIDGAGKGTLLSKLLPYLEQHSEHGAVLFRDPGATKAGGVLRELVKYGCEGERLGPRSEVALFTTARHEMTEKLIKPNLGSGRTVLVDRYQLSTDAYQGAGLGLLSEVSIMKALYTPLKPDLTIILDVNYETALWRIQARGEGSGDIIEARGKDYFERVRTHFLRAVEEDPTRTVVIDASKGPMDVYEQAIAHINQLLS